MGFLSSLREAVSETNEDVHGQRLLSQVQSTFDCFESLDLRTLGAVGVGYLQIRSRLNHEMINWTREGRLRIARQMQDQARQALDLDVAGSYAKWLAGAWLECGERTSQKAQVALHTLQMYESELRRTLNRQNINDSEMIRAAESTFAGSNRLVTQTHNEPVQPQDRGNAGYHPARLPNPNQIYSEPVLPPSKQSLCRNLRMTTNIDIACPHCELVTTGPVSSLTTVMNVRCAGCAKTFIWRREQHSALSDGT